jgi:hypothetical protein
LRIALFSCLNHHATVPVCREEDNLSENIQEAASHKQGKVTDTKLSPEQLEEV